MAVLEGGEPIVSENAEGGRTTPSSSPSPSRVSVRRHGRQAPGRHQSQNTVFSIKRSWAARSEVRERSSIVPYKVISGQTATRRVEAGRQRSTALPRSARMILGKLKADAEAYLGESVDAAVITVPRTSTTTSARHQGTPADRRP